MHEPEHGSQGDGVGDASSHVHHHAHHHNDVPTTTADEHDEKIESATPPAKHGHKRLDSAATPVRLSTPATARAGRRLSMSAVAESLPSPISRSLTPTGKSSRKDLLSPKANSRSASRDGLSPKHGIKSLKVKDKERSKEEENSSLRSSSKVSKDSTKDSASTRGDGKLGKTKDGSSPKGDRHHHAEEVDMEETAQNVKHKQHRAIRRWRRRTHTSALSKGVKDAVRIARMARVWAALRAYTRAVRSVTESGGVVPPTLDPFGSSNPILFGIRRRRPLIGGPSLHDGHHYDDDLDDASSRRVRGVLGAAYLFPRAREGKEKRSRDRKARKATLKVGGGDGHAKSASLAVGPDGRPDALLESLAANTSYSVGGKTGRRGLVAFDWLDEAEDSLEGKIRSEYVAKRLRTLFDALRRGGYLGRCQHSSFSTHTGLP